MFLNPTFLQSSGNMANIVRPVTLIFWSFMSIFILCNYSQNVTNHFDLINDGICRCDWYKFPHKVQQMIRLIMMKSQKPIIFIGFGNILLTRETFKKVSKFYIKCLKRKKKYFFSVIIRYR